MRHVSVEGDTYTTPMPGAETAGRYCLIDTIGPEGDGPRPHRHDLWEMSTLLDGKLDFTSRGKTRTVRASSSVDGSADAPQVFKNSSGRTAHMLCLRSTAGQEDFFMAVGIPVESRDAPPLKPSAELPVWPDGPLSTGGAPCAKQDRPIRNRAASDSRRPSEGDLGASQARMPGQAP